MYNYGYGYPYMNPQATLSNLVNSYPQYFNQNTQQAVSNSNQGYKVMLVSNEEEAKATPADLSGNPTFFYNKSMNKIYLKQINPQTGAAPLQVFNAELLPEQAIKTQPDEMMPMSEKYYNTIIEGINGLYRILAPRQDITTQPPIMTEEVKPVNKKKQNAE